MRITSALATAAAAAAIAVLWSGSYVQGLVVVNTNVNRRAVLAGFVSAAGAVAPALAAADCYKDCIKNCKLIAPKDPDYCKSNCSEYCSQEGRTDGLSGSVSASNGEVGILGGTFGQGTVPKGEDKPPSISLPGLDFASEKGRKLIGY